VAGAAPFVNLDIEQNPLDNSADLKVGVEMQATQVVVHSKVGLQQRCR